MMLVHHDLTRELTHGPSSKAFRGDPGPAAREVVHRGRAATKKYFKENSMTSNNGRHGLVDANRRQGRWLGLVGLVAAALLGACATQPEVVTMQTPGGPPQQVTIPKSTFTGAASGAQADALAQEIVDANNNTMKQFDQVDGRLDTLQATGSKELQTAHQALAQLEQMSSEQGTGQITLFFKTGSTEIDQFQYQRLVNFLDYLGRESRGRSVILVSIGSASATGNPQINKKLSIERSDAPLPVINQYLVNVPHKFYKVTGIGDLYAPKNAPLQVEARYQSVRIIAVYTASALPAIPKS
jgi:outer membrane protein OmpA-like peptidoglycan-associated protein